MARDRPVVISLLMALGILLDNTEQVLLSQHGLSSAQAWVAACYRPAMMSLLGAVGIAGREVKFLDPSETNGSKGALQVQDCRSRTRVWGAKMIRYRRSPLL